MNSIVLQILPVLLLIVLYLFIFTRKGEIQKAKVSFKGHDWLTLIATIFATNALVSAVRALGIKAPQWLPLTVSLLIPLVLLIVVLRRARSGKPIVKRMGDERINLIYAKSARNALFTTYSAFFVHILTTNANALDTRWVVITLGSGLIVLLASIYFYYYRRPDISS